MELKSLILIFLAIFSPFYSLLYALTQAELDEKLSDANSGRIYKENRIKKVLKDFSQQIQTCKTNVKVQDVTMALDNYYNLIQLLVTVDSFQTYQNISTCGDINYKIITHEFEQRKLQCVIDQIRKNTSLIYKSQNDLLIAYSKNLNSLGYLSSAERSVWNVTQQLTQILNPYWDYLRTLSIDFANLNYFNTLLAVFKKQFCQCLATVDYTGQNSTLEANVLVIESRLVTEQIKVLNASTIALSNAKTALKTNSLSSLQTLQSFLANLQSISDYPKISWSNIKNCNDFWIRVKYLEFKRSQYLTILISANQNSSLLTAYEARVNVSGSSSQQQVSTVIKSTIDLRKRFSSYTSLLGYALVRMAKMIGEVYFADTYCRCGISDGTTTSSSTIRTTSTSTTKVPTTTTKEPTTTTEEPTTTTEEPTTTTEEPTTTTEEPTTTTEEPATTTSTTTTSSTSTTSTSTTSTSTSTTIKPCGSFAPFDTVNGLSGPSTNGVSAGTFTDGTQIYMGYGDNSACAGESPCPGYLTDNPSKPGGYFHCLGWGVPQYKTTGNFYLLNHPDLKWVTTNRTHMMTLTKQLTVKGGSYPFFFDRTIINGTAYTGKVHSGNGWFGLYYISSLTKTEVELFTGYEILTC